MAFMLEDAIISLSLSHHVITIVLWTQLRQYEPILKRENNQQPRPSWS